LRLLEASAIGAIPRLTRHALERAVARRVTPDDIAAALASRRRYRQPDRAVVFVVRLHGRGYFFVVVATYGIVTVSRKDLTAGEIRRASITHGWQR